MKKRFRLDESDVESAMRTSRSSSSIVEVCESAPTLVLEGALLDITLISRRCSLIKVVMSSPLLLIGCVCRWLKANYSNRKR